jgi:ribosomal protein S18 acetylase RimI-like enzyme
VDDAGKDRAVQVRPRSGADLAACERIAREVHRSDGYPRFMPDDDYQGFLVSPDALGAWVAVAADDVVGHVALHRRTIEAAMQLAAGSIGCRAEELAVVARLFVASDARGGGVGRTLLRRAANDARTRGRWPVLDVSVELAPAVALYEAEGWVRLGTVAFDAAGTSFAEYVYVAPPG